MTFLHFSFVSIEKSALQVKDKIFITHNVVIKSALKRLNLIEIEITLYYNTNFQIFVESIVCS